MIDITRLRAETPGVEHVVHLNNAGSALMPSPVVDMILGYLEYEVLNGGYEAHAKFENEIDSVYGSLATLINGHSNEIALSDNATRAWDMAFYGMGLGEGDRILTTTTEYVSNWAAYLHLRDTRGIVVDVVPGTSDGEIDIDALDSMIDGSTKLITLNHIPTNTSVVNPAVAVGSVAKDHGVPFLLDACQSVGHLPVDVEEIGCDMLAATSRKYLRGPRGEGFLYVRTGFLDMLSPPFVEEFSALIIRPDSYVLKPDARRFETWEKNYANVLGMGAAADYAMSIGIESIWARISALAASLRDLLADLEGLVLHDIGSTKSGIVTFSVDGRPSIEVQELLSERKINVSVTTSRSAPIDMHERGLDSAVRASVHAYNSEAEIDTFIDAMSVIAS
ncbi:MAG: aminotransferase class V-fold PLP-dependent enzyme [Acidimicrobiia bacterium]